MVDDQIQEDEVLRRMLNTPHESHKPLKAKPTKAAKGKRTEVKDAHAR